MFGRRFRRGLRGSMSRRRSPARRYNTTGSGSSTTRATTRKPIKAITQQVNPIVDPKRPTKTVGTRRPIKPITQQVDPIVDPKRPTMTARPVTQKPEYVRPMYSEGGSVRTPKSNFGTTDYRKTGMTTHTSVRSRKN